MPMIVIWMALAWAIQIADSHQPTRSGSEIVRCFLE